MNRKWIQALAVAAVVGLGGSAIAQQQMQQAPQPQQTQQMQQGQQGQMMQHQIKSVRLQSLNQTQIKQVQTNLKDLGFYKGAVDGNLGTDTRNALLSYFQSQVTLAQQGRISDGALSGFGFDRSEIERVRGIDQGSSNVRQPTQGQDQMQQQQQQPQPQQQPLPQPQPQQQQPQY